MIKPPISSPFGRFSLRFVDESNQIEDLLLPEDTLVAAWHNGEGHMAAFQEAVDLAATRTALSVEVVCAWQARITSEQLPYGHWIAQEDIGRLRRQEMYAGSRQMFASALRIPGLLERLFSRINRELPLLSELPNPHQAGLKLAAQTHRRFELIHPFADGNGRSGRLVALYILRFLGISPVLFTASDREASYYPAFDCADHRLMLAYFRNHQLSDCPWDATEPAADEG